MTLPLAEGLLAGRYLGGIMLFDPNDLPVLGSLRMFCEFAPVDSHKKIYIALLTQGFHVKAAALGMLLG